MEPTERYLLHIVLVLAILTYAIDAIAVSTARFPIEASLTAAVPDTPVVLRMRFELGGAGVTVAVRAQLQQEPSALRPDLAQRTSSNAERTFDPERRRRASQRLLVTGWRAEEKSNKVLSALSEWRTDVASAVERAAGPQTH